MLDNSRLDELRVQIQTEVSRIGKSVCTIGELLAEAKELCGDKFGEWVRDTLNWNEAVADNLIAYRGNENKRLVAEAFILAQPELSDRQAAKATGLDHKTVGRVRQELMSSGEIPHSTERIGADGRVRRVPEPSVSRQALAETLAEKVRVRLVDVTQPVDALAKDLLERLGASLASDLVRQLQTLLSSAPSSEPDL